MPTHEIVPPEPPSAGPHAAATRLLKAGIDLRKPWTHEPRWLRIVLLLVIVVVGVLALTPLLLSAMLCRSQITQMQYSPSGKYLAQVEESDCGAVSGFDTDVALREKPFVLSRLWLRTASELINTNAAPSHIRVHWNGENDITVECEGCDPDKITILRREWRDVSVHYSFQSCTFKSQRNLP